MLTETRTLTVSQLTELITRTIQGNPGSGIVIVANELSNFVHHSSGHMYFTLKDENSASRASCLNPGTAGCSLRRKTCRRFMSGATSCVQKGRQLPTQVYAMEPEILGASCPGLCPTQRAVGLGRTFFAEERKPPGPGFPTGWGWLPPPQGAALQDFLITAKQLGWPVTFVLAPAYRPGRTGGAVRPGCPGAPHSGAGGRIVVTRGGGVSGRVVGFQRRGGGLRAVALPVPFPWSAPSGTKRTSPSAICRRCPGGDAHGGGAPALPDAAGLPWDLSWLRRHLAAALSGLLRARRARLDHLARRAPSAGKKLQLLLQPRQNRDHTAHKFKAVYARLLEQRRALWPGIRPPSGSPIPAVLDRGFSVVRTEKGIIKSVKSN